jgi:AcrR family transcriptional regulator
MAKRQQKDTKVKIIEAALDLAAQKGWANVSLADIARGNKLSLADLHEHFGDKADILAGFSRMVDARVLEGLGEIDSEALPRDRLFDILMERFDILNEYRPGLVSVLDSFKLDPKQFIIGLPHLCKSMSWMLEAAGMDTLGLRGAARLAGLSGLYIKNLRVWAGDESPDMGKTMAALDKDLRRAESLANSFGL